MVGVTFKKTKNISRHQKRPPASLPMAQKLGLKYIRAFDKLHASKTGKEKRATSPKIKRFMPKISEIDL